MMDTFDAYERCLDRRAFLRAAAASGASTLGLLAAPNAGIAHADETPKGERRVRVRVWCEATAPRTVYPGDVDGALTDHLGKEGGFSVQRARLTDPAAGLSDKALDDTDVLIWWGHLRHEDVPLDRAEAVVKRVREGRLGFVALHSSCSSRPFRGLMGTSCEHGGWREDGHPERVTVNAPDHPVTRGVGPFTIPRNDMFAEPFSVPEPETVLLISTWERGESVRSGLTWKVEKGRVVYLRAGHEAFPVLFHPAIRLLVMNAARWAANVG